MKKIFLISLLLQGLLMSAEIKKIEVNGVNIDVIYEESDYIPSVYMKFVFKDSGNLNAKKLGLAKFSASLLNEGTLSEGSYKFANKLEAKAISLYSVTGFETFNIEIEALKEQFDYGILQLKGLLKEPNYSDKSMKKIKKLSMAKIEKGKNNFDLVASQNLNSLIFKDSIMEFPSIGTKDTINDISLKDVKDYINSHLGYDNVMVVVGGDISFEDVTKSIKLILSDLPKSKTSQIDNIELQRPKESLNLVINKDTQQSYIYFASKFNLKYNDKNQYKALVASHILGASGFGSRMMEELRVNRGLTYGAYAYFVSMKFTNYFAGHLSTKLESQKEALEVVQQIVNEFVDKGVTKEELESTKRYILGSEPLKNESLSQRLNTAFNNFYYDRGLDYTSKRLKNIENLTIEELNEFIKSHKEIKDIVFSVVTTKR